MSRPNRIRSTKLVRLLRRSLSMAKKSKGKKRLRSHVGSCRRHQTYVSCESSRWSRIVSLLSEARRLPPAVVIRRNERNEGNEKTRY